MVVLYWVQEDLRKRITVSWVEATEDEVADEYLSSEDNSDEENGDSSYFKELSSVMETEQLPPTEAGIYEVEIGTDDCPEESPLVDESIECCQSNVYDNIDKNFRPSFQRKDWQTKSMHYFHAYAVADRLNLSEQYQKMLKLILLSFYQV